MQCVCVRTCVYFNDANTPIKVWELRRGSKGIAYHCKEKMIPELWLKILIGIYQIEVDSKKVVIEKTVSAKKGMKA